MTIMFCALIDPLQILKALPILILSHSPKPIQNRGLQTIKWIANKLKIYKIKLVKFSNIIMFKTEIMIYCQLDL